MNSEERDPIFASLDRLAGLADTDVRGDRMADIHRRVRVTRQRKGLGVVVAAALLSVVGVSAWQQLPSERSTPPITTPTTPTTPTTVTTAAPTVTTPAPTVTTPAGFSIADQLKTDLDGDGTDDVVRIRVPDDVAGNQELQVAWGTGETASTELPNTMERTNLDPVDLDGDGDRELILLGGGGETAIYTVFLADTNSVEQVKTVDASGDELVLSSPAEDLTAWHVSSGTDGIVSYQLINPTSGATPAPVRVRAWTLSGNTLTQSADSISECLLVYSPLKLGPC
jgi:hypothetical protein